MTQQLAVYDWALQVTRQAYPKKAPRMALARKVFFTDLVAAILSTEDRKLQFRSRQIVDFEGIAIKIDDEEMDRAGFGSSLVLVFVVPAFPHVEYAAFSLLDPLKVPK